jgi:hypothetical protein
MSLGQTLKGPSKNTPISLDVERVPLEGYLAFATLSNDEKVKCSSECFDYTATVLSGGLAAMWCHRG